MATVIFIFYLLLFSLITIKVPFFKNSGLPKTALLSLFIIKVIAGIAYAKFYTLPKYSEGSDTWRFYRLSLEEKKWLLSDPLAFFKDLFIHGYSSSGNLFSGENTYWNDLKSNVPVKLMALMNVITNSNYYANIILFNFLFLFGLVGLFKLLNELFPGKKLLIASALFLLPSTLFWCSGIHKDGLILSATGMIIYTFYKSIKSRFTITSILIIVLSLLLVFSLRNYVVLALIPALFCWWLSEKYSSKTLPVFLSVYSIGIILFFTVHYIVPSVNFPSFIAEKQHEFLLLEGASEVKTTRLEPTLKSFISFLPAALDMALLRPHLNEFKSVSYIPAAAEILLLFTIIIFVVFSIDRKNLSRPIVLFFFFFSFTILIICGYTIPVIGAVVRYRSFVFPLVIAPLLAITNLPSWLTKRIQ